MNKRTITIITLAGLVGLSAYTIYTLPAPEKPQVPAPVKKEAKAFPYEKEVHPFTPSLAVPLSDDLQRFTKAQADMNGVPYILALAVMEQESRFDLSADSGDSVGVMQINSSISSPYSREVMFRTEKFAVLLGEESVLRPPR